MTRYTQSNTYGFTDDELRALNEVFDHLAECNIPLGADPEDRREREQSIAEAVHQQFTPGDTAVRLVSRLASCGWHI